MKGSVPVAGILGLVALLAALLLAGCGEDRAAGNNGTSTDNVLTARISIDSVAFALARPDTGAYPLLVRLDSGAVRHDLTLPAGADLSVRFDDDSPAVFAVREWDRTSRLASVWVKIPRPLLGRNRQLRISYGDGVPRSLSDTQAVWKGVSPTLRRNLTSLVLADFEQDSLLTPLPCACNRWYANASPGTNLLTPAPGKPIESAIVADPTGKRTWVLHMSWNGPVGHWVLAGTRLGTRNHRLRTLDSITLRARGSGVLRVALEDGRDSSERSKAWAPVTLEPEWKRVVIRPSDFDPPDQWNYGWFAVRDRVNTFTLFGQQGTDLWVDDVVLHGVGPQDLP